MEILKDLMNFLTGWRDAINVLIGAGIGGLVTTIAAKLQFERERKWQRDRLLQEKLLEIAQLTDDLQRAFAKLCGDAVVALYGGAELKVAPIPLARLKILTTFYASDLRHDMERIIKVRDDAGPSLTEVLTNRKALEITKRQQIGDHLLQAMKEMNDSCDRLAENAAELAQRHLGLDNQPAW
jgi:hypothetical protein